MVVVLPAPKVRRRGLAHDLAGVVSGEVRFDDGGRSC